MTCWSCGGGIPEGSRFCGLCGAHQNPTAPQITQALTAWQPPPERESETPTLINAPALAQPAAPLAADPPRPAPRFRALAAAADGPARLPAQPVSPTAWGISEAPGEAPAPEGSDATTVQDATAVEPPVAAPVEPTAEAAFDGAQTAPDAPAIADTTPTVPDAPALRPRSSRPAADPAPISDAPPRSSVVASREPPPLEAASVVVALPEETAPEDPAVARLDLPAIEAPARPRGIGETGWFMDALDPDALSDIDVDGVEARRRRAERPAPAVDPSVRRQFSLGGPDPAPIDATARELDLGRPPARRGSASGAGILLVACAAAAAAAWWFTR